MLVEQLLVVAVLRETLLLQLLDLDNLGVEQLLQLCLLVLNLSQLVGGVSQLNPQLIDVLLELIDGLEGELQLQSAFLVTLGLP